MIYYNGKPVGQSINLGKQVHQQQPVQASGGYYLAPQQQPVQSLGGYYLAPQQQPVQANGGYYLAPQQQPVQGSGGYYLAPQQQPVQGIGGQQPIQAIGGQQPTTRTQYDPLQSQALITNLLVPNNNTGVLPGALNGPLVNNLLGSNSLSAAVSLLS